MNSVPNSAKHSALQQMGYVHCARALCPVVSALRVVVRALGAVVSVHCALSCARSWPVACACALYRAQVATPASIATQKPGRDPKSA